MPPVPRTRQNVARQNPVAPVTPPPSDGVEIAAQPATETRPNAFCTMSHKDFLTSSGRMMQTEEEDETLRAILKRAAFLKRGIDPWANVPQAVHVGSTMELLEHFSVLEATDPAYDEAEKSRAERTVKKCKNKETLYKAYVGIKALFHDFDEYFARQSKEQREHIWVRIKSAAESARNNDTSSLKKSVHMYPIENGQPSPAFDNNKSKRGLNHPQLLRMLVPMTALHFHGNDHDFEQQVREKKHPITHSSLPAFMFDTDAWDPSFPLQGLLRGHYPLRVFKHIFIGPGSALLGPGERGKGTRPGNAEIARVSECTPAMIAYACVQARFHISTMNTFGPVDGSFNIKRFYYDIIQLFENKESQWVQDTLSWWDYQVFGDRADGNEDEEEEFDEAAVDDEGSFANILALINDEALPVQPPSQTQEDSQYEADTFPIDPRLLGVN